MELDLREAADDREDHASVDVFKLKENSSLEPRTAAGVLYAISHNGARHR